MKLYQQLKGKSIAKHFDVLSFTRVSIHSHVDLSVEEFHFKSPATSKHACHSTNGNETQNKMGFSECWIKNNSEVETFCQCNNRVLCYARKHNLLTFAAELLLN